MHLTSDQIEAYWNRSLAPAALLALDRHIGQCPPCREALASAAPDAGFRFPGESVGTRGHLEYEQIEEYIDGRDSQEAHAAVDNHISVCRSCRYEVADLRHFRGEYRRRAQKNRPPIRNSWYWAIAAAVLAGIFALFHFRPSAPVYTVLLRDSGQPVGLDSKGLLYGARTESRLVAGLLSGGSLPLAALPESLRANSDSMRGSAAAAKFAVADPLGRVVLEDRPLFRWSALPGASSYRVQILDLNYDLVLESPDLTAAEWKPSQALARGRTYSWQVVAQRKGGEVNAPRPPASEARFQILDAPQAARLNAALNVRPFSHLALAALYAQAGMLRECRAELGLLELENPGSPLLARLRAQLP